MQGVDEPWQAWRPRRPRRRVQGNVGERVRDAQRGRVHDEDLGDGAYSGDGGECEDYPTKSGRLGRTFSFNMYSAELRTSRHQE